MKKNLQFILSSALLSLTFLVLQIHLSQAMDHLEILERDDKKSPHQNTV